MVRAAAGAPGRTNPVTRDPASSDDAAVPVAADVRHQRQRDERAAPMRFDERREVDVGQRVAVDDEERHRPGDR